MAILFISPKIVFKYLFVVSTFLSLSSCSSSKKNATAFSDLQFKYARIMNVPPHYIRNNKLYSFIDEWLNTTYKWGGDSKNGIDCSAFIRKLLKEVYRIEIPRTSVNQFYTKQMELFSSTKYLSEGDLVFFRTDNEKIVSHVGLYLCKNKFVNSSSSSGVGIADLTSKYWRSRFVGAGRVKILNISTTQFQYSLTLFAADLKFM